jgi:Na+/H+ antiporter NhaC
MLAAERRARGADRPRAAADDAAAEAVNENLLLRAKKGRPRRLVNALVPIGLLVATVGVGFYVTGEGESLQDIVGSADSYKALLWASLVGTLAATALVWGQRILTLEEIVEAWSNGAKLMFFAMVVLILAWSLGDVAGVLHTADFLLTLVGESMPAGLIPLLVFLLAAATSFATGSSWGTMALLVPLVVPLTWGVLGGSGTPDLGILYSAVACVLTGSVWGDHCSPISDTTILSSMATGCRHIDHVSTQLPYALLVGGVAVVLGTLPTAFGVPIIVSYLISAAVLVGVLLWRGERV